jgi:ribosomal protein L10
MPGFVTLLVPFWGDIMMQVSDIAVAVAAVAVAVAATIAAGATGGTFAGVAAATWKTAALCVTVAAAGYRTMRSGISTHDLQLFGQDRDRAESRQNTMNFVSSWGSVAVAGTSSWIKTMPAFTKGAEVAGALNTLGRNSLIVLEMGVQMAAAQAGGADSKTMWSVGALAIATTFVNGGFSAEGLALQAADVTALAGLPSKNQLIAEVVAQLLSPVHDTVNALSGNLHGLLDGIEAKAAQ